jgi:hypothetical protein
MSRLVHLLYDLDGVVERTGFTKYWASLLHTDGVLPTYSRSPLRFEVQEIEAWCTPQNLQCYAENRDGMFCAQDKPKHPNARKW